MSKRNKLSKFAELSKMKMVFQCYDFKNPEIIDHKGKAVQLKGAWSSLVFNNNNPLILELAAGRAEYALALAEKYPENNYIAVDIKGARLWRGAKNAIDKKLENIAFLRCRIEQIESFFAAKEVSEIWITFPDPFLRDSKENRRLTSANFLKRFRKILDDGAKCHLKTDNQPLYEFSLESIKSEGLTLVYSNDDIYANELYNEDLSFKTYYERMHLENGLKIKYIQFCY